MNAKTTWLALLAGAVLAQAGKLEENVVELVENGRTAEAQALAKRSPMEEGERVRLTAILYHAQALPDSALVWLRKAQAASPGDPRIELRLAEALVWKKDFLRAEEALGRVTDRAVAADPRPWEPASRRAAVRLYLKDLDGARAGYLQVAGLAAAPRSWSLAARIQIAQIAAWQKEFDLALAMADSVLALDPGAVQASLVKGQVQEWLGRYPDARTTYSAALQRHPGDARLRERLEKLSWVK